MKRFMVYMLVITMVLLGCSDEEEVYFVEFNSEGGGRVSTLIVEKGTLLEEPYVEKEGYIFQGWYYIGDNDIEQWNFEEDRVEDNTELFVIWLHNHFYYGGTLSDSFSDVLVTDDNGYIVVGYSSSQDDYLNGPHGLLDGIIMKFDDQNELVWDLYFGGSSNESFQSVIDVGNGEYIAVGATMSTDGDITDGNSGVSTGLMVKFDSLGHVIWHKTIGRDFADSLLSVVLDENGDYLAVGYSYNTNLEWSEGYVVKVDSSGDVLWQSFIEDDKNLLLSSVINDGDNIVAVGHSYYADYNDMDELVEMRHPVILSIDENGDVLWKHKSISDSIDKLNDIVKSDDGFIAVGYSFVDGSVNSLYNGLVIKYDSNGSVLWRQSKSYNDRDYFSSLVLEENGDLIIVGHTDMLDGTGNEAILVERDILIVKLDSSGEDIDMATYNDGEAEHASAVVINPDGYYTCVGYSLVKERDYIDTSSQDRDGLFWIMNDFNQE